VNAQSYMEHQAIGHIRSWKRSNAKDLNDVYGEFSSAKYIAWKHCEHACKVLNGTDLKVITHNSCTFTAGFQFIDKETGVIRFMYISPTFKYIVDMQ